MEKSRIFLWKWLFGIHMMATARKGFSSVQFAKHMGATQKTAWYMEHRIRKACEDDTPILSGETEIDETYLRSKRFNTINAGLKALADTGREVVGKTPVVDMKERDRKVVAIPVVQKDQASLFSIIDERVKGRSKVYTDEAIVYMKLKNAIDHEAVKHFISEYVQDKASTNSIESFWALIKRAYYGTHRFWTFKYLHRYVAEYVYHNNTRHLIGVESIAPLIKASESRTLSNANLVKQ